MEGWVVVHSEGYVAREGETVVRGVVTDGSSEARQAAEGVIRAQSGGAGWRYIVPAFATHLWMWQGELNWSAGAQRGVCGKEEFAQLHAPRGDVNVSVEFMFSVDMVVNEAAVEEEMEKTRARLERNLVLALHRDVKLRQVGPGFPAVAEPVRSYGEVPGGEELPSNSMRGSAPFFDQPSIPFPG